MTDLTSKRCLACEAGVPPLNAEKINTLLAQVPEWQLDSEKQFISRRYTFKNFYHTMAFVNAVAFIANQEGHHPDMEIGYNYCNMKFTTHAIEGLSENDFICAAKVDSLTR